MHAAATATVLIEYECVVIDGLSTQVHVLCLSVNNACPGEIPSHEVRCDLRARNVRCWSRLISLYRHFKNYPLIQISALFQPHGDAKDELWYIVHAAERVSLPCFSPKEHIHRAKYSKVNLSKIFKIERYGRAIN
jgi:hypothetical protein